MPRDYRIKNLKDGLDVIEALSSPEQVASDGVARMGVVAERVRDGRGRPYPAAAA